MENKGSSSYEVAFVRKPGYLHAVVTGRNSPENVIGYLEQVRRESAAAGVARVLIEERLAGPRLDLMRVFEIASLQGRLPENVPTIAYVDVNAAGSSMAFAEDVAVNRGVNVRVFGSVADAEQWLRGLAAAA